MEGHSGIYKFVWIVIIGGVLIGMLYVYPAIFQITEALQSTNATWSTNGTSIATTSPTSEWIAQAWPFMLFAILVGGCLYIMVKVARR